MIRFNQNIEDDTSSLATEPAVKKLRKKEKKRIKGDYSILIVVFFLSAFGLMMVYSATSYKYEDYYLKRQIIADLLGLVALVAAAFFPYNWLKKFSFLIYLISVGGIFLVLTPLGVTAGNATRWIRIKGGFNLQPAEITKIGMILLMAAFITKIGEGVNRLQALALVLVLTAIPAVLIKKINDNLSTAIIVFSIGFLMYMIACQSKIIWALVVGLGAMGCAGVWYYIVRKINDTNPQKSMRILRIMAWLHPEDYSDETSYQTLQALYAIGSGGVLGKGPGEGIQKLENIPEAHNDMIFSVVCEELGLFGAFAIMFLFLILIYICMTVAQNAKDMYGKMIATGVMIHLALQVILNISVVTNTIPNTGISLPFISYGGSSLIFLMAEIGLVINVSRGPIEFVNPFKRRHGKEVRKPEIKEA